MSRRHGFAVAAFLLLLLLPAARLDAQQLVRDIRTAAVAPESWGAFEFTDLGGVAIFLWDGPWGRELARSDGTQAGTYVLKDIAVTTSYPFHLVKAGGYVYFVYDAPGIGRELWRTDGTTAGTILLGDLVAGPNHNQFLGSYPSALGHPKVEFGGQLYFSSPDQYGAQVYRSDGTPGGTAKIESRSDTAFFASYEIAVGGGSLWYGCRGGLHRSDGSLGGAVMVSPNVSNNAAVKLTPAGSRVFFLRSVPSSTQELHVSDGTAGGTSLVIDLPPANPNIAEIVALGSNVLFNANDGTNGDELWFSDGTALGTAMLANANPGSGSSAPRNLVESGGKVFFVANDGTSGNELWVSDGTPGGTQRVVDLRPGSSHGVEGAPFAHNGGVLFEGNDALEDGLFFSDGTPGGTYRVRDLTVGGANSNPGNFGRIGSDVWFTAKTSQQTGFDIYKTDGTFAGTVLVATQNYAIGHAEPSSLTLAHGGMLFSADDGATGREPWWSDGTGPGTFQLANLYVSSSQPSMAVSDPIVPLGATTWFTARTPSTGLELFKTDGTPGGTGLGVEIVAGYQNASIWHLTGAAGKLWFGSTPSGYGGESWTEPWVSDGTAGGTFELSDLVAGTPSDGSMPREFTEFAGRVFFTAGNGTLSNRELFSTDGTPGGTSLFLELNPTAGSSVANLTVAGSRMFFTATNGTSGIEPWVSDGTPGGTQLLDITAYYSSYPTFSSEPEQLTAVGNDVFFYARPSFGAGIWKSDGTIAGTVELHRIANSIVGAAVPSDLTAVGNRLFFFLDEDPYGDELWVSDGTPGGTQLVRDIRPGFADAVVRGTLTAIPSSNAVAFAAHDGENGLQLWISDGTPGGTNRAGQLGPRSGVGAAEIGAIVPYFGDAYFVANDGSTGLELWRLGLTGAGIAWGANYGSGCPGTGGLVPRMGHYGRPALGTRSFGFMLDNARTTAPAALLLSFAPTRLSFGCDILVAPPILTAASVLTDASGRAAVPLDLTTNPAQIGLASFWQWFVLDTAGGLLNLVAVSDGLQASLGL